MSESESKKPRPAMMSLRFPDKSSLYKSYMPFLKNGGLFVATNKRYHMGDELFVLVTLPSEEKPSPVPCHIVWKTPADAQSGSPQGVGVEFTGKEGEAMRARILGLLKNRIADPKPTYTM